MLKNTFSDVAVCKYQHDTLPTLTLVTHLKVMSVQEHPTLQEPADCIPVYPKVLDLKTELVTALDYLKAWKQQSFRVNATDYLTFTEQRIIKIKQEFDEQQKQLERLKACATSTESDIEKLQTCLVRLEVQYNDHLIEHDTLKSLKLESRVEFSNIEVMRQKLKNCLFALINKSLREMNGFVDVWSFRGNVMKRTQIQVTGWDHTFQKMYYIRNEIRCVVTRFKMDGEIKTLYILPICLPGFEEHETIDIYVSVFKIFDRKFCIVE